MIVAFHVSFRKMLTLKCTLYRYMGQMYTLDAFTVSCPADQDILSHYKMQQGTKMSRREELETPTYTNDVPATAQ